METVPVSDELHTDPLLREKIQQRGNGVSLKQVSERSKLQAARIARDKLKAMFSDEIGIFFCCGECCDNHHLQWKNQWKVLHKWILCRIFLDIN